jgi:hypothetical protein
MEYSNSMLCSYSLVMITVFLATSILIQTVTASNISAQQNNLNPFTTSFTPAYYSIPNAAGEEEDDDDIAEHNRNADKQHD